MKLDEITPELLTDLFIELLTTIGHKNNYNSTTRDGHPCNVYEFHMMALTAVLKSDIGDFNPDDPKDVERVFKMHKYHLYKFILKDIKKIFKGRKKNRDKAIEMGILT